MFPGNGEIRLLSKLWQRPAENQVLIINEAVHI
jgi:hypothetical protein